MKDKDSRADHDPDYAVPERLHADDIRRELSRIVQSSTFRDSYRLTSFLSFIVETTLAGNGGKLKAYTIAVEALGRGPDFDPQTDPIVRVEAVRMRQALTRYYSGVGRDDPLVIEVPRGSYVPAFSRGGIACERPSPRTPNAISPPTRSAQERSTEVNTRRREFSESIRRCRELAKAHRQQADAMADAVRQARRALLDSRELLRACRRLDLACGHDRPLLPTAERLQTKEIRPTNGREAQRQQAQSTSAPRVRRSRSN
jgi:hypothetical protein